MEKKNNIQKLVSKKPSQWKEKAMARIEQPWLSHYSSQIARRIVAIINQGDKELNQTRLAEKLGVKRQYISKVIQGNENLSLKTIWEFSKALDFELLAFPEYKYSSRREKVSPVEVQPEPKLNQLSDIPTQRTSNTPEPIKVSSHEEKGASKYYAESKAA
jgi:transcriptional regulator with XRE-family HTH domain